VRTQLLCTFAHSSDLELIIDYISNAYIVSEDRLFVFANRDVPAELYVTYNVEPSATKRTQNTISIHRKKDTNTLYTVNALNTIIRRANNGILDKTFIINWEVYKNSLLLTNGEDLRHIYLKLVNRIDL